VYELKFVFHMSAVLSSVPVGEQCKLLGTRSSHRRAEGRRSHPSGRSRGSVDVELASCHR